VNFINAVRMALARTFDFQGRSRRSEYWWFNLALLPAYVLQEVDDEVAVVIGVAISLLTFVTLLSLSIRRLHDINMSAWWLLLGLIPLAGWIALICFACQDGTPGANRYGPSPKAQVAPGYSATYTAPVPRRVFVDSEGNVHPLPDAPPPG